MSNNGAWKAKIVTEANFVPIPKAKRGRRKATEESEQLIRVSDAITTTWMILRGLGYTPEENKELAKTVKEVFATTPPALPPHGRLGDLDALSLSVEESREKYPHTDGTAIRHHKAEHDHFLYLISCAPTIIPADMQMPDEFHGTDEGGGGVVYDKNGEVTSWGIVGPPGEAGDSGDWTS